MHSLLSYRFERWPPLMNKPRPPYDSNPAFNCSVYSRRNFANWSERIACLTRFMVSRKNARLWCVNRMLRQHFPRLIKMPDESPRMSPANRTVALLVQRPLIFDVASVFDVQFSARGKCLPVPAVARRQNTIEHIDATGDRFNQDLPACRLPSNNAAGSLGIRGAISSITSNITCFSSPTLSPPIA